MSAKRFTILFFLVVMAMGADAPAQNFRGRTRRRKPRPSTHMQTSHVVEDGMALEESIVGDGYVTDGYVDFNDSGPIPAKSTYQAGDVFCEGDCDNAGCYGLPDFSFVSSLCLGVPKWSAGFEFTLLRPHFENNPAFTILESDGDTSNSLTQTQFQFDRELAPRVWIEALSNDRFGVRAIWWNFDHSSDTMVGAPPGNGFGEVSPPLFGTVDLSTTVPGSRFTASHDLRATTIDLEATKSLQVGQMGWLTGFGFRYGEIVQRYNGSLENENNVQTGTIDYSHQVEGFGPTLSVRSQRPWSSQLMLFGIARGSLLFGTGESQLTAVEDLNLDDRLTTTESLSRNDLIPIGELQLGVQWTPPACGALRPYMHVAMESQLWGGAGNASSEDENLGFFGYNIALGFDF